MTIGPALDGRTIPVPDNVKVVRSAPHSAILPRAQVVVSHCGHGTTLKALSHGVPILCLPMGRDQGDNAARVVWHGARLRLRPTAPTAEIESALKELIANQRYRERASALASRMKAENSSDRAVAELERL
jgi:UDP:flavonoid glycosyltransferase YjiC (YdhE family)